MRLLLNGNTRQPLLHTHADFGLPKLEADEPRIAQRIAVWATPSGACVLKPSLPIETGAPVCLPKGKGSCEKGVATRSKKASANAPQQLCRVN